MHVGRPPTGQSAQADFAIFQRRIHSLRLGGDDRGINSVRLGRTTVKREPGHELKTGIRMIGEV